MSDIKDINFIITGTREYAIGYIKQLMAKPASRKTLEILQQAEIYESCNERRATVLEALLRASAKLSKALPPVVTDAEVMLSGPAAGALSPLEAALAATVETGWGEARRLAELAKNYSRASTAAKALCGIKLRALREHYFGPRNPNGGRPKKSANGELSWVSLLADKVGISDQAGSNWMKMADVVEAMAEGENLGLRDTLEKLPWDWTPAESAAVDAAVQRLTEDRTQRELLQSDFLSDLGYTAPERLNSSNNPLGTNGGKKKVTLNPAELLKQRQEVARLALFRCDKPGRAEPGSVAHGMVLILNNAGKDIEALPKSEMKYFYDMNLKPFADLIRSIIARG